MRLPWQRTRAGAVAPAHLSRAQLPGPSHPVTLAMPDGARLPARVAEHDDDELLVLLMVPLRAPLIEAEMRRTVLETSVSGGMMRMAGNATVEEDDLIRLRDLHSIEVLQRRSYVRVKTARPVLVSLPGTLAPIESSSVDISGGGMLLGGPGHLKVGEQVKFRITTEPDGARITGTGTVVRVEPGRPAIAFESITDGDRRRLIRFLFERQRIERRKGLQTEGSDGRL